MTRSKITRSHSTFTPSAEKLRRWAEKEPAITKISAGWITRTNQSQLHLKIKENEPACLVVCVKANSAHQEVRLYCQQEYRKMLISLLFAYAKENNFST